MSCNFVPLLFATLSGFTTCGFLTTRFMHPLSSNFSISLVTKSGWSRADLLLSNSTLFGIVTNGILYPFSIISTTKLVAPICFHSYTLSFKWPTHTHVFVTVVCVLLYEFESRDMFSINKGLFDSLLSTILSKFTILRSKQVNSLFGVYFFFQMEEGKKKQNKTNMKLAVNLNNSPWAWPCKP